MANEGKRSKGRFLYLFDWNAKSRKKLFSNKSESSDRSFQGKENIDNMVKYQCQLREMREICDYPSFKGSGSYSCSSSVNGDGGYVAKAPGVVARLMGLDTMPTATSHEETSVSPDESHAVISSFYSHGATPCQHDCHMMNYSYTPYKRDGVTWNSTDSRTSKVRDRPFERFQTEVLPPKSAKPISVTRHRLLSPIKNPGFVTYKDAAHIMEAAARIIDPAPPVGRSKISSLGSPSSSFRIHDLRDRMDAGQRLFRLSDTPMTPKQSPSVHHIRGKPSDRSSHRPLLKNTMDCQISKSEKMKSNCKSVSVPVQDKSTVQKRNSLTSSDRSQLQKEQKRGKRKQKEPNTQRAGPSRASRTNTSGVLRQNSDKQNSVSCRDKSNSKASVSAQQLRKGDNTAGPSKIVRKVFVKAENGSKKAIGTIVSEQGRLNDTADRQPSLNKMKNLSRGKQTPTGNDCEVEHAPNIGGETSVVCDAFPHNDPWRDMDVISFTFSSPIKKSGSSSLSSPEPIRTRDYILSVESKDEGRPDTKISGSPPVGLKLVDSGSLSHLLEQKLQELTDKIGSAKPLIMAKGSDMDSMSCLSESISSHGLAGTTTVECDDWSDRVQTSTNFYDDFSSPIETRSSQKEENLEGFEEHLVNVAFKASQECCTGHLNVTLPECSVSGSCLSSAASDLTKGYDQPSSPQSQEVISSLSTESYLPREDDALVDATSQWELKYVRYMLYYTGLKGYRLVEGCKFIDPGLFDLLENLLNSSGRNTEQCSKLERRILFDCVTESVSASYERAFFGSYKSWAKGCFLLQNEWLTEEVSKDIFGWQSLRNLLVDELVDWDMSTRYGKWLDFNLESLEEGIEIEVDILSDMVDELVIDLSVQILSR